MKDNDRLKAMLGATPPPGYAEAIVRFFAPQPFTFVLSDYQTPWAVERGEPHRFEIYSYRHTDPDRVGIETLQEFIRTMRLPAKHLRYLAMQLMPKTETWFWYFWSKAMHEESLREKNAPRRIPDTTGAEL